MVIKKKTPAIPAGKKVVKNRKPKKPVIKPFEQFLTFQPMINAEAHVRRGLQLAAHERYKNLIAGGMPEEEALLKSDLSAPVQELFKLTDSANENVKLKAVDTFLKYTTNKGEDDDLPTIVIERKELTNE